MIQITKEQLEKLATERSKNIIKFVSLVNELETNVKTDPAEIANVLEHDVPLCVLHHGFVIERVQQDGGSEGGGDLVDWVYCIYKNVEQVTNRPYKRVGGEPVVYFRTTGFYSSYNGIEWDAGVKIVYPYQKLVTFYTDDPAKIEVASDHQRIESV